MIRDSRPDRLQRWRRRRASGGHFEVGLTEGNPGIADIDEFEEGGSTHASNMRIALNNDGLKRPSRRNSPDGPCGSENKKQPISAVPNCTRARPEGSNDATSHAGRRARNAGKFAAESRRFLSARFARAGLLRFARNDARAEPASAQIQFLEKIIALVVDDDEGRKIHHLDAPDRFHAEFGIFHVSTFLMQCSARLAAAPPIEPR